MLAEIGIVGFQGSIVLFYCPVYYENVQACFLQVTASLSHYMEEKSDVYARMHHDSQVEGVHFLSPAFCGILPPYPDVWRSLSYKGLSACYSPEI